MCAHLQEADSSDAPDKEGDKWGGLFDGEYWESHLKYLAERAEQLKRSADVPLIPVEIARDDRDASEAVVRASAGDAQNEESQSDHMESVGAPLAEDGAVVGEDKDESVVGALGLAMFNIPSRELWGGLTNEALRLCVTPTASLLAAKQFEACPNDVPTVSESDRRVIDLKTRCSTEVSTWTDVNGKERTGAVIIIEKSAQKIEFVKGPVTLELYLLVLQMNKKNSVVSRGTVMNVGDLGLGVIVMVVRESNKVFSRDECWFLFVWMLAEGRLYLLNATAREQYKRDHPDNEQRVLMKMLANTVTDLEKGLSDD